MSAGRPLRFLGTVVGGWVVLRAIALWPHAAALDRSPVAFALDQPQVAAVPSWRAAIARKSRRGDRLVAHPPSRSASIRALPYAAPHRPVIVVTPRTSVASGVAPVRHIERTTTFPPPFVLPPIAPLRAGASASRWRGSAWMIARGGSAQTILGGQLGASQAGARLTYAIDPDRRIALAGRISAPLHGRGSEVAIGVDWQPTRLPVHIIAEQRIGLVGNRGGPTIELVGGIGPIAVAPGLQAEGYAQAGAIARDGIAPFADGAGRLTHPVARLDRLRLDLGLGAWGGAQRGAARLDIGPTIGLVVPVGRSALRLTADWRRRVAGTAAPGSGPALSIGSDF